MSYTQKTEFYEIPLPIETDLYNPMDYNESMEGVDTALHGAVTNAATAVDTADAASAAAGEAVTGLEALSGTVNEEKGKLTALTARVTAAENEIDDVRADSNDMICAYNEATATSTHAYSIGDYFIYNNVLYKATANISIGNTIVPDTNCTTTNITTELASDTVHTLDSNFNCYYTKIDHVVTIQLFRLDYNVTATSFNIGILPAAYRPKFSTRTTNGSNADISANQGVLVIDTDGTVHITMLSTGSHNLAFNVSFIVD